MPHPPTTLRVQLDYSGLGVHCELDFGLISGRGDLTVVAKLFQAGGVDDGLLVMAIRRGDVGFGHGGHRQEHIAR
jgi:hypothetical protein